MLVQDIRDIFTRMLRHNHLNAEGMLEIIGASFTADRSFIFGEPNTEYIKKEIEWYNSMSRNVYDMENPPTIWRQVASRHGMINSNYGWCIFSEENGSQFENVVKKLLETPHTRQATMIYTRPSMHIDAVEDGMSDFMCTNTVTYKMYDGVLNAIVQMRSNDAVYGYKNDFAWQDYVLGKLCDRLGYLKGYITWQAASLHVYPRHFHLIGESKEYQKSLF